MTSLLDTCIQHYTRMSSQRNQARNGKGTQIGKGKIKLPLFTYEKILHEENPKDPLKKTVKTKK